MYKRIQVSGFTLVELMIVIVIVSILAAIAYPSYRSSILRSHRSDGQAGVLACAVAQERWFTQNTSYATQSDVDTNCTGSNLSMCSCKNTRDGFFAITIPSATTAAFTATATATSKGGQTDDTSCRTVSINQASTRSATDSSGNSSTSTCWKS